MLYFCQFSHLITFTLHALDAIFTGVKRIYMGKEKDPVRCPACGSVLTGPSVSPGIWECRYYLCRAIFPVKECRGYQGDSNQGEI
jgi:hypothetical protein